MHVVSKLHPVHEDNVIEMKAPDRCNNNNKWASACGLLGTMNIDSRFE